MKIRITIADDHPLIQQGMKMLVGRYPHIVLGGIFGTGTELLGGLKTFVPDVILLDIQLPDRSGDELANVILKEYPGIRILMLTNFNSPLYVHNSMRNGAHGYLLKTTDEDTLITAIETVYNGGTYIESSLRKKMEQAPRDHQRIHTTKTKLSSRENEILQLIVNGNTDPEIAERLYLSLHTVKRYRINILLKLDVKNTAALVNKALKLGLAV